MGAHTSNSVHVVFGTKDPFRYTSFSVQSNLVHVGIYFDTFALKMYIIVSSDVILCYKVV